MTMKSESDVLRQFAEEIARRLSNKTISALQKITATLSGDDTELKNAWDEICVQQQHEHSFYWATFDETARSILRSYIAELERHEELALRFQTSPGRDWLDEDENDRAEYPPVLEEEIVEYVLHEYVYWQAGNWSNKRIRAYLDRQYLD